MNGYEFYPEDGSTLYEEEAWELSEQARSLWLRLTFAGEYSESMSPVQIQGRKYLPMFPARDGVYTIEQVQEKFLAVFSEEFTDKTLNAAIASKDLLEYNGNVYAAYKKNRGETSYNSWADHVRDDGAGKFTVVMGVSMPSNGSTVYVELPTEKTRQASSYLRIIPTGIGLNLHLTCGHREHMHKTLFMSSASRTCANASA